MAEQTYSRLQSDLHSLTLGLVHSICIRNLIIKVNIRVKRKMQADG